MYFGPVTCSARKTTRYGSNPFAIWTSGDATMERMAGINWKLNEYCRLSPVGILLDFRQWETRKYQIIATELVNSVGIVVFRGDIWNGGQIVLLVSYNQNTSSWVDKRFAKGASPSASRKPFAACVKWQRSVSALFKKFTQCAPGFHYA